MHEPDFAASDRMLQRPNKTGELSQIERPALKTKFRLRFTNWEAIREIERKMRLTDDNPGPVDHEKLEFLSQAQGAALPNN